MNIISGCTQLAAGTLPYVYNNLNNMIPSRFKLSPQKEQLARSYFGVGFGALVFQGLTLANGTSSLKNRLIISLTAAVIGGLATHKYKQKESKFFAAQVVANNILGIASLAAGKYCFALGALVPMQILVADIFLSKAVKSAIFKYCDEKKSQAEKSAIFKYCDEKKSQIVEKYNSITTQITEKYASYKKVKSDDNDIIVKD